MEPRWIDGHGLRIPENDACLHEAQGADAGLLSTGQGSRRELALFCILPSPSPCPCPNPPQVILRGEKEPTVELFCKKIHRTLINDFKYGWVWGSSVKHNPGRVGKAHVLQDEDVIQIVKKV